MDNKILIYARWGIILAVLIGTGCQTSGGPAREQVLDLYHSHDRHTIYFNSTQRVSEVLVRRPDRRLDILRYTKDKNWVILEDIHDPPFEDVQDQRYVVFHVVTKTQIVNQLVGLGVDWKVVGWDSMEEHILCVNRK
ncbi:MAG: hypothetical protein KDK27_17630, partial [Leptospiraceae bacterium]|nr:hypothetical protein [Leptospiraceae bacterium]